MFTQVDYIALNYEFALLKPRVLLIFNEGKKMPLLSKEQRFYFLLLFCPAN